MNKPLKILYVEDEESIREEMIEILKLDYDDVHVAVNGEEAVEIYKRLHPDIVISDIQMPIMDGISMSKEILSIDENAKIILITAFNEKSYIEETEAIGVKSYLNKPVNIDELFEKIEAVLASEKR